MLHGSFDEVEPQLLSRLERRIDVGCVQCEVIDRSGRARSIVDSPHLKGEVAQAQERAPALTIGEDAGYVKAELRVVVNRSLEICRRNANMLNTRKISC